LPPDLSLGPSSAPSKSVFLVIEYNHTLQKEVSLSPSSGGHRSTAPGVVHIQPCSHFLYAVM